MRATVGPLLIADLDGTLVDRERAFRRWVQRWSVDHEVEVDEAALVAVDADGYRQRDEFAALAADALCADASAVLAHYVSVYPTCFVLDPAVERALRSLRSAGVALGVVTNGPPFQLDVLRQTGIDCLVDAVVVSEVAGVRKPDARILDVLCAHLGRRHIGSAAVIGDGLADIELAAAAGLPSIWLERGRKWADQGLVPTASARTFSEAVGMLAVHDDRINVRT